MTNNFKLEFPNLACNEGFARMAATAFILELDPTCAELSEIKTAVSEAVTNAIIHGYKNKSGTVILEGNLSENTVTFTITDFGEGIENIEMARKPLYTGSCDSERSGMGFTIMEAFTDSMTVTSKKGEGTTVTLTKVIGKGAPEND